MIKNQEITPLVQTYVTLFKCTHYNTLTLIRFYDNKYKLLQSEITKHEENEPLIIFKRAHKNWKNRKDKLSIELEKTFNILVEEYIEFENLIGLPYNNN